MPALPKRLGCGKVENFAFFGGKVSFEWQGTDFEAVLTAQRDLTVKITLPEGEYLIGGQKYHPDQAYTFSNGEKIIIKRVN